MTELTPDQVTRLLGQPLIQVFEEIAELDDVRHYKMKVAAALMLQQFHDNAASVVNGPFGAIVQRVADQALAFEFAENQWTARFDQVFNQFDGMTDALAGITTHLERYMAHIEERMRKQSERIEAVTSRVDQLNQRIQELLSQPPLEAP